MENTPQKILPRRPVIKIAVYVIAGFLLAAWLLNTPSGIMGKADAVGYAVCHKIAVRSFNLPGERPMPLCARCTGMYLGAVTGLTFLYITSGKRSGNPPWGVISVLGVLVAIFAIDGLNSYLHLFPGAPRIYEPHNWLRLLTGTGTGLAMATALFVAYNQTVWAKVDYQPVISGWRSLGLLLLLAGVVDLLVLAEIPFVLYIMALISAIGVMILLTMIHSMLIVLLLKMDNKVNSLREMGFPLVGGFTVALLQIAAADLVRYWLTGTWEGFHFG